MNKRIKRYEWDDALIAAQADGIISNGALLVCLKLSKAITWLPKSGGKPSGLYWKNDDALMSVGCGRSTYHKHRQEIFDAGFLRVEKGNLIPQMPKSTLEPDGPQDGLKKSTVETSESTGDNPYSGDSYSEDSSSGDTCSGKAAPVSASASTSASEVREDVTRDDEFFTNLESIAAGSSVLIADGEPQESTVETCHTTKPELTVPVVQLTAEQRKERARRSVEEFWDETPVRIGARK